MKLENPSTKFSRRSGCRLAAFADDARPERFDDRGTDAERDRALNARSIGADVVGHLRRLAQQRMRPLQQEKPRIGQFELAPRAQDQLEPDLVLELADLPAERRLGDAQLHGGFGKASRLGDIDEIAERSQIHRGSLTFQSTFQFAHADTA